MHKMLNICVICMCPCSVDALSVEHREILESLVSSSVNLAQLRNTSLLVCSSCVSLIKALVEFRQTAIAGVTHFLQLWSKDKKVIEPGEVLIKEEPPDNDEKSLESAFAMELVPEFVNLQDNIKSESQNELKSETTENSDNIQETIPESTIQGSDTNKGVTIDHTKQAPSLNQTEKTAVFIHSKTSNCSSRPETPAVATEAVTNTPKPISEQLDSLRASKKRKTPLILTRNERRDLVNIYNYLKITSPTYPLKGQLYKATAEIMGVSEILVRREMKKCRRSQAKLEDSLDPNPPQLVCTDCNISFVNVAAYRSHRSTLRHTSKDTRTIIFECDACHKKYSRKEQIKLHIQTKHMVMKASKCEECGKSYSRAGSLWNHVRKHQTAGRERPRPFVCDVCGKTFMIKKSLTEHLYKHSGLRPYKCQECPDTFTYRAALFTHNRLKHLKTKNEKK